MKALIAGSMSGALESQLKQMFELGGVPTLVETDLDAARNYLRDNETPCATIVHFDSHGGRDFIRWVRRQSGLQGMVLLAVVDWADASAFARAETLGVDDLLVDGDRVGLLRRARLLSALDPTARKTSRRGRCVVEHPDPVQRVGLGRVLTQSGFDVHFVCDLEELTAPSTLAPVPALVVLAEPMSVPEAIARTARVRKASGRPELPCVITLSGEDAIRARGMADKFSSIGIIPVGASPADTLYVVNQLLTRTAARNERVSRRLLFETLCSFRETDADGSPSWGLTYNASRGGIFVRTFNLPARQTHLEVRFRPPHSPTALTLTGRVAWIRGPHDDATTPVGLGIEFIQDACDPRDWASYQEAIRMAEEAQPTGVVRELRPAPVKPVPMFRERNRLMSAP